LFDPDWLTKISLSLARAPVPSRAAIAVMVAKRFMVSPYFLRTARVDVCPGNLARAFGIRFRVPIRSTG